MKQILLSALLLCSLALTAQQRVLFNEDKNSILNYTYANVQGNSRNTVQDLLRNLLPNNYSNASYDLHYTTHARVTEGAPGQWSLSMRINTIYADNVPRFKSFDCADIFVPMTLNIKVQTMKGTTVLDSRSFDAVQISNGQASDLTWNFTDTSHLTGNASLVVSNISFDYTNANSDALRRRLTSVGAYEQAANSITGMGNTLLTMNVTNPDPDAVNAMLADLGAMDRNFQDIQAAEFWRELKLRQPNPVDPLNINNLSARFTQDFPLKRQQVMTLSANLPLLYHDRAALAYQQGQKERALADLNKSIQIDPNYTPSHYLIALIDFEQNRIEASAQRVTKIFNQLQSDPNTRQSSLALADKIRDNYIASGVAARDARRYNDAVKHFSDAKAFCKGLRNYSFNEQNLNDLIASAYSADFDERARLMLDAYNRGDLASALRQADDLKAFQQQNNIRSEYDLPRFRYQLLVDVYRKEANACEGYNTAKDYANAISSIGKLETFTNKYKAEIPADLGLNALKSKVYTSIYDDKIKDAKALQAKAATGIQQKQFAIALQDQSEALKSYGEAEAFYKQFPALISNPATVFGEELRRQNVDYLLRQAKQSYDNKAYSDALTQALKAQSFASNYGIDTKAASQQVYDARFAIYKSIVAEGDALTAQNRPDEALRKYNEAKEQDRLYGFSTGNPSVSIDNKITGSAKSDLINRINVGLAANQDIPAYQILYRDVQSTVATYQLQNDDDVSRAVQQIQTRICTLAQARLDASAAEADNFARGNNYIAARDAQTRGLAINAEFGVCHLDLTRLNTQRDRINACAEYQDKLHLAQDAERTGNYDRAIENFISAARAYDAPLVAGNLPKDASYNLYDYIHASTVGAFNFSGALYYSDESHKDIDKSYDLLKLALAHRQNPKSTSFLQNRLGAAFAEKLYQPGTKSKDAIAQVVPAELKKALKTFSKAMCKRWKQLR